jgi:hypothetical protein
MADPKPHVVARWIADDLPGDGFRTLRTAIEEVLRIHLRSTSAEYISELAEALEPSVYVQLGVVDDQCRSDGVEASFILDGPPEGAYLKPTGLEARALLADLAALDPVEFEHFCVRLLLALGADSRQVGGTNDGCVDFEAVDLPLRSGLLATSKCRPTVIGQAKRYKPGNLVTVAEVREFLGAALLKADQLRRRSTAIGLYSPIVFAFWTTSNLNAPARELWVP